MAYTTKVEVITMSRLLVVPLPDTRIAARLSCTSG